MSFDTRIRTSSTSGAVTVGSGSTLILASNSSRKDANFTNDSDEVIYLQRGKPAVIGEGIPLAVGNGGVAGGSYTIDANNLYTGSINAICASGGKELLVTEGV